VTFDGNGGSRRKRGLVRKYERRSIDEVPGTDVLHAVEDRIVVDRDPGDEGTAELGSTRSRLALGVGAGDAAKVSVHGRGRDEDPLPPAVGWICGVRGRSVWARWVDGAVARCGRARIASDRLAPAIDRIDVRRELEVASGEPGERHETCRRESRGPHPT